MAKKRRSSQFKDTSQVIDIEEARRKRQEKRQKQQRRMQQEAPAQQRPVRASVKAGRRKKTLIYAVIIICIIAAIGISALNIVKLKAEYNEAEKQNQQLQQQKEALQNELKDISEDKFIEEEARQQLRMVKPGEYVYIVPFGNEKNSQQSTESEE